MRILVIGGGAREHALAWKLSQEAEVICAPGNPGIAADVECVDVSAFDFDGLVNLCQTRKIDLVVVGPEDPLVAGVADKTRVAGFPTFGPGADGAFLEGSKAFSKEVMDAAGVPTAEFQTFDNPEAAEAYARQRFAAGRALAVKANGNALGKGVVVADTLEAALDAIDRMMVKKELGEAGSVVVLEDKLPGPEFSLITIVGDNNIVSLPIAQDHKRVFDGDQGPNTGGMGTFSPVTWVSEDLVRKVEETVVNPALSELKKRGISFRGFLFSGLMMDGEVARCLEYNVRFGDPECQTLMLRLGKGLAQALLQAATGETITPPEIVECAALTVVTACEGYPSSPRKGDPISIGSIPPESKLFHAGTALKNGELVTNGGRVISASSAAPTLTEAHKLAYQAIAEVKFQGAHYRKDIGATDL